MKPIILFLLLCGCPEAPSEIQLTACTKACAPYGMASDSDTTGCICKSTACGPNP